jgi:LysR family transcriptional regulator, low CO2-responsive transcriptional regulator
MLDAHPLNIFLVAAETLNFTEAAQRLHMTQPSVSQHIQNLENHFGTQLFIRAGRRLELSDAGLALVPMARELVNQSVRIEEEMSCLKGRVFGQLKVGCSTTPGKYILPHLLTSFHHKHPRVKVTCLVASQRQTLEMLCEGAVHFALTSQSPEACRELEIHFFTSDPVVLIAPLEHPWAREGEVELQDLRKANFILREETSGTYMATADALQGAGMRINDLNTILTLGNSEAIALAVQQGLGVGFVSRIVTENITREQVAKIKIRGLEITREIMIARNPNYPPTTAQTTFWEFLRELPVPYTPAASSPTVLTVEVGQYVELRGNN